MSFLSIWTATIIVSSIYEIKNELKIFKDFADAGYKFNIEKMKDIKTNDLPGSNTSTLSMLIPFYNLFTVVKRKNMYEENKDVIFNQYEKLGILEEMNEEEKEVYSLNPNGWNAIVVAAHYTNTSEIKKEIQPKTIASNTKQIVKMIIKEENNQTNIITIRMNTSETTDTIEILELTGQIKDFQREEMTSYIMEHMGLIMEGKNISVKRTEELIEITLTKIKPKTKLERYIELRDMLKEQGYLYGEQMWEYHELKDELEHKHKLTK